MAISNWEAIKASVPSINFWLQLTPAGIANTITSHLVHCIFSTSTPSASEPSESALRWCWEKLTTAGTAIHQIASRNGLGQQNSVKARLGSFDQIFEYIHQTLFDPQKFHENLAAGKSALQKRSYTDAKRSFSKCLKTAQGSDLKFEREAAVCLAEVYVQEARAVMGESGKKLLIKASGLFNYALNVAKKENNQSEINSICLRLKEAEKALFSLLQKSFSYDENCHTQNRSVLEAIRNEIGQNMPQDSHSIAEIQEILEFTTAKMKAFRADLLNQALRSLGGAPCTFAMIGFGSLARGEMTPYSDLEFAFLVEDEQYTSFFRDLTYLLHFKVLCLGETILPALGIASLNGFTDCITARGFAFDGAGVVGKGHKTPLGCPGSFELIHTPQEMAAFQGKKTGSEQYWFEFEPYLPMELQQFTWVAGNDAAKLAKDYEGAIETILNQPYKNTTLRCYMSKELLAHEDYDTFLPDMQLSGRVVNVKRELYRLPHLFLQRLCLFHKIKKESSWEKTDALKSKGVLKPKVAERFKELFAITMWYRFSTYMQFKSQNENKNPLVLQAQNQPQTQVEQKVAKGLQNLPQIEHLYSILIPMLEMMRRFSISEVLDDDDLYNGNNATLAIINFRLMHVKKAKTYHALAVKDDPKDLVMLFNFLLVLFNLNEYDKVLEMIKPLLAAFEANGAEKMNKDVAYCYFLRGRIYNERGRVQEAIRTFQLINAKFEPISVDEKILTFWINGDLGEIYRKLLNMQEAKTYHLKAIQIARESLSELPLLNAQALLFSGIIHLGQEEYDKAIDYFRRVLVTHRPILGDTHPANFVCLENLCITYRLKKDFTSCIALAKQSLKKLQNVHSSNLTRQLQILKTSFLTELGLAFIEQGEEKESQNCKWEAQKSYTEAIAVFEKAILEDKRLYGEMHEYMGSDLIYLGRAYVEHGNLDQSIACLETAVKIFSISPEDFPVQLSEALSCLGVSLAEKARVEKNSEAKILSERALFCFNASYELLKKNCPDQSARIAPNLILLAFAYASLENFKKSKKALLLAVEEVEKLPSNHHLKLKIMRVFNALRLASDYKKY